MNKKTVVLLSGGLDSTTLLSLAIFEDFEVLPLSIFYGQRHHIETDAAQAVCKHYGLQWKGFDVGIDAREMFRGSSQTDNIAVPHGHYADESMRVTVVPNRNMVLLALATAYAISNGAGMVAYAAHAGDHAIYPDCRPQFATAMGKAINLCHFEPVNLYTPFLVKSKAEIVKFGQSLHVPFHLTWSCYDPQLNFDADHPVVPAAQLDLRTHKHCGKCGTCVERKEAFQIAMVTDPTEYAA